MLVTRGQTSLGITGVSFHIPPLSTRARVRLSRGAPLHGVHFLYFAHVGLPLASLFPLLKKDFGPEGASLRVDLLYFSLL